MNLIVFDMDGVLIDVSQSYNLAIKKTVEFFLGRIISMDTINEFKSKPGMNNDWDCTEAILRQFQTDVTRKVIIKKFQEYYLGRDFDGLINNEKLLIKEDTLKKLSKKYLLAIFTGRPRKEAEYVLDKFKIIKYFMEIVSMEDVLLQKPNPEGLNKIMRKLDKSTAIYVGDSIDDLTAAKNAGIQFVGVINPNGNKEVLNMLFKNNGAKQILTNINDILKIKF